MFIRNFQGAYEHPYTAETLKTIKQKHDESLRDYAKCLYNVRNAIPYIQNIEIINAFYDGVSNVRIVEEITMKKLNMMADLLAVADICIEASEAQAWVLESHGKGSTKKRQDGQEVNTTDRGDHGDHENRQQQPVDQMEKRHFHRSDDAEKRCEIHHTTGHDLKE
jgi:hypothetical protein